MRSGVRDVFMSTTGANRSPLQVTVLGSGSRGNALLVDGSAGTLLIDAGYGPRALQQRLHAVGRRHEEIQGLLLTHEHVDHASGAPAVSAKWGVTVHATPRTLAALDTLPDGASMHRAALAEQGVSVVAGFEITHCAVPHDAADCRALRLTDVASGASMAVVLDCGAVTNTLAGFLRDADLLVVESNHDREMLANGPYPRVLKQRIRGGRGHLSNAETAELLAACAHKGLQGVLLAHLSETNNTAGHAVEAARGALSKAGWRKELLWACAQREATPAVGVRGMGGGQLSLF